MIFFIRECRVVAYARSVLNAFESSKSRLLPATNLANESRFTYCKSCNLGDNLSAHDANVRKYLDYLTNIYKVKDTKDKYAKQILASYTAKDLVEQRINIINDIESLKDLATEDKGMEDLRKEEELLYKNNLYQIDEKLLDSVLESITEEVCDGAIVEITAGVGGQESMIFVKDLFYMYTGYLNNLGLNYEIIDLDDCGQNALRNVSISVAGKEAYERLKYEGGVHRVQRIPATEKSGRIHTSTAAVAIMPQPSEIEVCLHEKDLKIEAKKASGAGGQHVNTTDSAIRVTHLPTGIVVTCQVDRSQIKNRKWALLRLRSILYEQQYNDQVSIARELRKKQKGMSLRSEKIRTYNYNQDRVTDHRLADGTMHNLKDFMQGGIGLEQLQDKLKKDMQKELFLQIIKMSEEQLK